MSYISKLNAAGEMVQTSLPSLSNLLGHPDEIEEVLAGGTTGQVLKKNSGTDFDIDWADDGSGEEEAATSWSNGIGERRLFISATPTGTFSGNASKILAPVPSNDFYFASTAGAQQVVLDFTTPMVVDGFAILQDVVQNQGTWDFEGSLNGVDYVGLDVGFAWSPASANGLIKLVRTFVNSTAYRYYRLKKTAGSTSDSAYFSWLALRCEQIG